MLKTLMIYLYRTNAQISVKIYSVRRQTLRFKLVKAFNKASTDKLIAQLEATTSPVSWFTALA